VTPLLLVADHASNAVPDDIALGIDPALLEDHIAVDIGTAALTRALAAGLGAPAVLAEVSRLVCDVNRPPEHSVPLSSDGIVVPGNAGADVAARAARFHAPHHARIEAFEAAFLVSVHSFTPRLRTRPDAARPWEVGILYNDDDRAARLVMELLRKTGCITGDNEPYSGRELNYTMNRHAEARGVPYIGFEFRQDLVGDARGVAHWAQIAADVVARVRAAFA
jgi:predicted N-formylglutamate amidohydrolase